jgi:hypothetical protein
MSLSAANRAARYIFDFDRARLPRVFYFVGATSALSLIVDSVRWQLVSILTVFVAPFIELVILAPFVGVVWAILHAIFPLRGSRPNRFSPLLLSLTTAAILVFVPFDWILLKVDFAINLHSRTVAAERILAGIQQESPMSGGRGDLVHLNGFQHRLSEDGDVMVWHTAQKQMVFFFTFRGILDSFSGFIYSANDLPPEKEDFGGEWVEVQHLRKNWYWAASRN